MVMLTETPSRMAGEAVSMAVGMVDATLGANERLATIARAWIDESLGVQQVFAETLKRAIEDAQSAFVSDDETPGMPNMLTCAARAGEYSRHAFSLWTEAGLRATERYGRLVRVAFDEMRTLQGMMLGGDGVGPVQRRAARGG